jgi:periplasmic divalent cation tolerance protein
LKAITFCVERTLMAILIVFTTLPDSNSAVKLAETLVEKRHAACVHLLPAGLSVYRWEGRIEHADEVTLLIKTTQAAYAELETAIRATHPYDLPEILAVPVTAGLPAYIEWVNAETRISP